VTPERIDQLTARGWVLSRDGSTATAFREWQDPDDPDNGWEMLVLHTAGHGARFTLNVLGSGLTERTSAEVAALREALEEASELLASWSGEPAKDEEE